jgi:hypothetical protein
LYLLAACSLQLYSVFAFDFVPFCLFAFLPLCLYAFLPLAFSFLLSAVFDYPVQMYKFEANKC